MTPPTDLAEIRTDTVPATNKHMHTTTANDKTTAPFSDFPFIKFFKPSVSSGASSPRILPVPSLLTSQALYPLSVYSGANACVEEWLLFPHAARREDQQYLVSADSDVMQWELQRLSTELKDFFADSIGTHDIVLSMPQLGLEHFPHGDLSEMALADLWQWYKQLCGRQGVDYHTTSLDVKLEIRPFSNHHTVRLLEQLSFSDGFEANPIDLTDAGGSPIFAHVEDLELEDAEEPTEVEVSEDGEEAMEVDVSEDGADSTEVDASEDTEELIEGDVAEPAETSDGTTNAAEEMEEEEASAEATEGMPTQKEAELAESMETKLADGEEMHSPTEMTPEDAADELEEANGLSFLTGDSVLQEHTPQKNTSDVATPLEAVTPHASQSSNAHADTTRKDHQGECTAALQQGDLSAALGQGDQDNIERDDFKENNDAGHLDVVLNEADLADEFARMERELAEAEAVADAYTRSSSPQHTKEDTQPTKRKMQDQLQDDEVKRSKVEASPATLIST